MSTLKSKAIVCTALFLAGCGDRATVDNLRARLLDLRSQVIDRPSERIDRLFQSDTIHSTRTYIENKYGPAKYIDRDFFTDGVGDLRTYDIDGCTVLIGYDEKGIVDNIGIKGISRKCQFPISRFAQGASKNILVDMSFKDVDPSGNSLLFARVSSIGLGGSATPDPSVDVLISGAHSDNFIDILLSESYPYSDEQKFYSSLSTLDRVLKSRNLNNISSVCLSSRRLGIIFANTSIKSIRVGYGLSMKEKLCDNTL